MSQELRKATSCLQEARSMGMRLFSKQFRMGYSPKLNFRFTASLLKNPFAPSSAPGSGVEYSVFVAF